MPARTPRVYVDACVYVNVLKHEAGFWRDALKVLVAVERGDITLVASRLLVVEAGRFAGDRDRSAVDEQMRRYLEVPGTEWAELDLIVSREARRLSWEHQLRDAGDAVHLATALRRRCDYFVSNDKAFPYGSTLDHTKIVRPQVLWDSTTDDVTIDDMPDLEPPPSDAAPEA